MGKLIELNDRIEEVWVPLSGYEGRYEVSNKGRVKSLANSYPGGMYKQTINRYEKILKPNYNSGYVHVSIGRKNNETGAYYQKSSKVHRLVAIAFISNPENKKTVNHIDGNKANNAVENLEWATHKENDRHARDTKLSDLNIRVLQMDMNGNFIREYKSIAEASRVSGTTRSGIARCATGKWAHARGFKWVYLDSPKPYFADRSNQSKNLKNPKKKGNNKHSIKKVLKKSRHR